MFVQFDNEVVVFGIEEAGVGRGARGGREGGGGNPVEFYV